jgi:hypothetical protein
MERIKDGALKAVAASRPNTSKSDIISEPSERMVKESGDTYCDNTGVKTNLLPAGGQLHSSILMDRLLTTKSFFLAGQAPGTSMGLYVSRGQLMLRVLSSVLDEAN